MSRNIKATTGLQKQLYLAKCNKILKNVNISLLNSKQALGYAYPLKTESIACHGKVTTRYPLKILWLFQYPNSFLPAKNVGTCSVIYWSFPCHGDIHLIWIFQVIIIINYFFFTICDYSIAPNQVIIFSSYVN